MIALTQKKREELIAVAKKRIKHYQSMKQSQDSSTDRPSGGIEFDYQLSISLMEVALVSLTTESVMVCDELYQAIVGIQNGNFHRAGRTVTVQAKGMYGQDNMHPIYTAPPVPEIKFPEKLPCDVSVSPNVVFRKGVKTQTLLNCLTRKSEYSNERE